MPNKTVFYTVHILLLTLVLSGCGGTSRSSVNRHPMTSGEKSSAPVATASSQRLMDSSSSSADIQSTIRYEKILSQALDRQIGFAIYVPADYDTSKSYPVLYIMYGYGGSEFAMFNSFMSVNRTADKMIAAGNMKPMILVVPDYKNSFAVNSTRTQNPNSSGGTIGLFENSLLRGAIYLKEIIFQRFPSC